jgi:hypothetical protein
MKIRLPEKISGWLLGGTLWAVSALVAFFCGNIYKDIAPAFLASVLPKVSQDALWSLSALLALLATLLLIWIVYLHRRTCIEDRFSGYAFDPETGIATKKKTGEKHCPRCLIEINQAVPLVRTPANVVLKCVRKECGTEFCEKTG